MTKVEKKRYREVAPVENSIIHSMCLICSLEEVLIFPINSKAFYSGACVPYLWLYLGRRQRERGVRPTVHQLKVSLEQLYNGFSKKLKVCFHS
ncbi:unnamed protein product [Strongylus vulgaris]|uniref:Uncharacterized protein n=1 Tax=Strongylus vulgaris TaxID=40348 RepID=A0A3P7JUU3_STRVU|nr:unnamed protein product [Strongylus vulgaris]